MHLARDEEESELRITRAEGSHIWSGNRRFIDFTSGWCVGNLGWEVEELRERLHRYDGPQYVSPTLMYDAWEELAAELCHTVPGRFTHCYRATGGTEAVEIALQLARAATGRKQFVAVRDAYHGNSIAIQDMVASRRSIPAPLDDDALERVDRVLKKRDVAALIMEPIIINLDVHVPSRSFMSGLQRLCHRYGTLLILDEVATGFGRTGKLFATEHFDVQPDIVTLGKAVTSGWAPMGATLATEEVYRASKSDVNPWSTYGWHPIAVEAALGTLAFWRRHGSVVLRNVEERSDQLRLGLQAITGSGARMNVAGLAIAVEVDGAEQVYQRCEEQGLLLSSSDECVTMFPPLQLDGATAREALEIFSRCVRQIRERPRPEAQASASS
jgi:acetylornithine/succinyldiaminopimelate/putrescine aminotransferase